MDDDDLRRGRPTSHKVFGEAAAILAGDALLTEAFRLMARPDLAKDVSARRRLQAVHIVALGAGSRGMVGGQAMDMACEGRAIQADILEYIHAHKTGALIGAAVAAGAVIGGGSPRQVRTLEDYGRKIGLAFQILDDLLDVEGEKKAMGKAVGKDRAKGKATYPAFFGIEDSRRKAEGLIGEATACLNSFDRGANPLREIARYILQRKN
jgi:geranylgeranyl diphosphate synthase type II